MLMAAALLLGLAACLVLPFALYVLWALVASRSKPTSQTLAKGVAEGVSLIVVAHRAAALLDAKLQNCRELDIDELEVIVYLDGADSESIAVVDNYPEVRLIEDAQQRGKIHGMNRAVEIARNPVLVFSDVDAILARDSLHHLLRPLADPRIGGVCGQRVIRREEGHDALAQVQSGYIDLDSRIKMAESRAGQLTSNDGKLYAIRRALYQPVPDAVTDDLYVALQVVAQRCQFVFEPAAVAGISRPSRDLQHETVRRRRIVSTSLRGIGLMFRPLRMSVGWGYVTRLLINKVLRRLLPIGLLLGAAGVFLLLPVVLQFGLLLLALAGVAAWQADLLPGRLAYALNGVWGTLLGCIDFVTGNTPKTWRPLKDDSDSRPRIAYTMSRFPKITETFVLYEILTLQQQGVGVAIYPLLLEKENTHHPEVGGLMEQVVFAPFINGAVLFSNIGWLVARPHRFLKAWYHALKSAWPNRNFVIGALGVLPKCAWYAVQMRRQGIEHIHAHFATHAALAARFIHDMTGISYSFTAHGHDVHISLQGFEQKAADAAFWVTISEYNLNLLADAFGPEVNHNAHKVHCGVDFDKLHAVEKQPGDVFQLLCVASFKEVKGHKWLIEACQMLHDQGIDFHCTLIGDGPLRAEIEEQIRTAGLTEAFTLMGQQPQPVVMDAMRSADVVTLNSILASRGDREGIPVSLMEAMALQTAVVASDLSGIPELIDDEQNGLLVPQKDAKALAHALQRLALAPALRKRFGVSGRNKVLAEFDLQQNTAQLAALFATQLGRRVA